MRLRDISGGRLVQSFTQSKANYVGDRISFSLLGGEWCWFFLPPYIGKMEDSFFPHFPTCFHVALSPLIFSSMSQCYMQAYDNQSARNTMNICFLLSCLRKAVFPLLTRLRSIKWLAVYRVGMFIISSCHFRQCVYSSLFHPVFILAALCLQISGSCFLVIAAALIFLLFLFLRQYYFPRFCKQHLCITTCVSCTP